MGKKIQKRAYVYRAGIPRITETMDKHYSQRGTGHQGTGIYAYGSKERAMSGGEQEVYRIDVTGMNFFTPRKIIPKRYYLDGQVDLKKLSESMNGMFYAHAYKENGWYGSSLDALMNNAYYHAKELLGKNESVVDDVKDAVKFATVEWDDGKSLPEISQPINRLLLSRGYDGVDPGPELRDDNSVGIVIFNESFCIDTKEMENVDVGVKIAL